MGESDLALDEMQEFMEEFEERKEDLKERAEELDKRAKELDEKEDRLDRWQETLSKKAKEVKEEREALGEEKKEQKGKEETKKEVEEQEDKEVEQDIFSDYRGIDDISELERTMILEERQMLETKREKLDELLDLVSTFKEDIYKSQKEMLDRTERLFEEGENPPGVNQDKQKGKGGPDNEEIVDEERGKSRYEKRETQDPDIEGSAADEDEKKHDIEQDKNDVNNFEEKNAPLDQSDTEDQPEDEITEDEITEDEDIKKASKEKDTLKEPDVDEVFGDTESKTEKGKSRTESKKKSWGKKKKKKKKKKRSKYSVCPKCGKKALMVKNKDAKCKNCGFKTDDIREYKSKKKSSQKKKKKNHKTCPKCGKNALMVKNGAAKCRSCGFKTKDISKYYYKGKKKKNTSKAY